MILYRKDHVFFTLHSLYGSVQQVAVGYHQRSLRKAFFLHRKRMILRSNLYFPAFQILYRVIASPVAKLQFISLCPICQGNNLVAQTDAEKRPVLMNQWSLRMYSREQL